MIALKIQLKIEITCTPGILSYINFFLAVTAVGSNCYLECINIWREHAIISLRSVTRQRLGMNVRHSRARHAYLPFHEFITKEIKTFE